MIRENLLSISSWPEAQSTEKLAAELWAQSLSWLLGSSALKLRGMGTRLGMGLIVTAAKHK